MHLMTAQEVQYDLRKLLHAAVPPLPTNFSGLSIDSRTVHPGDLFIAIQGNCFNGHDYVSLAFARGAGAAVVERPVDGDGPLLVVSDTMQALVALGQGGRRRAAHAQIVGVTGSVGKTGTKEALRHVLTPQRAHANAASLNNHWGTPLSLGLMPRDTVFGIFELGMNAPGEIADLAQQVRPHVALITTIGEAHKGFFASLETVADAKAEIFQGMEPNGIAVLNRDDPFFDRLCRAARSKGISFVLSFGEDPQADIRLLELRSEATGSHLKVSCRGQVVEGWLAHPGRHWASNALGILGVGITLGLMPGDVLERLGTLPSLPGRGQRISVQLPGKNLLLLDESYNANPTSMRAALGLLTQQPGRRIAVLGDMLELGETEVKDHVALGEYIREQAIDLVFTCGPLMRHLDEALSPHQRGGWAAEVETLFPLVDSCLQGGDALMMKGSRKMQLCRLRDHVCALQTA